MTGAPSLRTSSYESRVFSEVQAWWAFLPRSLILGREEEGSVKKESLLGTSR
jgi:hypothetical protein